MVRKETGQTLILDMLWSLRILEQCKCKQKWRRLGKVGLKNRGLRGLKLTQYCILALNYFRVSPENGYNFNAYLIRICPRIKQHI